MRRGEGDVPYDLSENGRLLGAATGDEAYGGRKRRQECQSADMDIRQPLQKVNLTAAAFLR